MPYTVQEINEIRSICDLLLTVYNTSYDAKEKAIEVASLFQAHITNGTPIQDLRDALSEKNKRDEATRDFMKSLRQRYADQEQKYKSDREEMLRSATPKIRALETWFDDCIVRGCGRDSSELYFYGPIGYSLNNWLKNNGEDGMRISQKEMETFLTEKGIATKVVNGMRRFDCAQLISGTARSGNYST